MPHPPAVGDRREARRVPTDPAPPGRRAATASTAQGARRAGRGGPVPAAGGADAHAGRRGPDPQRHAAPVPGAFRDHPERVRRRPGRAREGSAQGDPGRGSGVARARSRPRDPGPSEPPAGPGCQIGRPCPGRVGEGAQGGLERDRQGQHRSPGDRRAPRRPGAQLRAVPAVHQGAEADDGEPWRDGRQDAAGRERPERGRSRGEPHPAGAGALLAERHRGAQHARRHSRRRPARTRHRAAHDRVARRLHRRRAQPFHEPRKAPHEPARRRRHRAPDDADLQRDAFLERVRRARPLPAHDAAGGLQLARDSRQPGLHRELHQGRKRGGLEPGAQAADRTRQDPGGRGSREGHARLPAPAAPRAAP